MILTDKKILEAIEKGQIVIEPFRPECLGTNSYDVHLGKWLANYRDSVLDARQHNQIDQFEIPEEGFVLLPGVLYLRSAEESKRQKGAPVKLETVLAKARKK